MHSDVEAGGFILPSRAGWRFLLATVLTAILADATHVARAQTTVPLPGRTLIKLLADPLRPRLYAVEPGNGIRPGAVLALDPQNGSILEERPVGLRPTDAALNGEVSALFVVNAGSRTITRIRLDPFRVSDERTIATPNTYDPGNPLHLAAGATNRVFFTDGGWAPAVQVLDFESGRVGTPLALASGAGRLAATRDGLDLFVWSQFGWSAGLGNSQLHRLDARGPDLAAVATSGFVLTRDPLDTPVLLDAAQARVVAKQCVFSTVNLTQPLASFPENIYAITPRGDVAFGREGVFLTATGESRTNLPFASVVQAVTSDARTLALYRPFPSELRLQPLAELLGVGWDTNTPPVAALAWNVPRPTTRTDLVFDASASTDDQGIGTPLDFRWDWNADGVWDTDFSSDPRATHRFPLAGRHTVVLAVRDRYGLVTQTEATLEIPFAEDPDHPEAEVTFELPFAAADLAFDPIRPRLYATAAASRSLTVLSLGDGLPERGFDFKRTPESLVVSPDGARLAVALLRRPHSAYWFGGHTNDVALFRLGDGSMEREGTFQVEADPFDLALTDSGILLMSGGSDQWTELHTYRVPEGILLGKTGVSQLTRLALHPSQAAVYTADTWLSPSDLGRISFDPKTGVVLDAWDSPYHGDYPMAGGVFCDPRGEVVLSRGGTVLTSSADRGKDLRFIRSLDVGMIEGAFADLEHATLFTVGEARLRRFNLESLEPVSDQPVDSGTRVVHATSAFLYTVAILGERTVVRRLLNPARGAETNQTPVAAFTWKPTPATTQSTLAFDASETRDDGGIEGNLMFRWDWNGDGTPDTPYTNSPLAGIRFNTAGSRTVILTVRDRLGALASVSHVVDISAATDPGEPGSPGQAAFEVQFAAAAVAFDPVRPLAYLTDPAARRLEFLDLDTGLIRRSFRFDLTPESIAVSPDGRRMYVALLRRPHSSYWFGGHSTALAEFDLDAGVKLREFDLAADPHEMAVTDQGILIVAGGSDQWTELATYRATTGERLGGSQIYERSRIALHPSQTAVYAADTALSPSDLRRYAFDPASGAVQSAWDSPYHGEYTMGGRVWCDPRGTMVLSAGGDLFASSPDQVSDLRHLTSLTGLALDGAEYDMTHRCLLTSSGRLLRVYELDTLGLLFSRPITGAPRYLRAASGRVFLARIESGVTRFEVIRNPALPIPGLMVEPEDVRQSLGGTAILTATASGRPTPAYQWYQDGAAVPGGTNPSLRLDSLTAAHAGAYQLVVRNTEGSATSRVAQVVVLLPPTLLRPIPNRTALDGDTVQLSVEAAGTPPLSFEWTFNGLPSTLGSNATLTLGPLSQAHAGAYRVRVRNEAGQTTSAPTVLRVLPAPPVLAIEATPSELDAGSDLTLQVMPQGSGPFLVTWLLNQVTIITNTLPTLTLTNLQAAHAGTYAVRVENLLGSASAVVTELRVRPARPRLVQEPEAVTIPAGGDAPFLALARGSDPIGYQWLREGVPVPGATGPNLLVEAVRLGDDAEYSLLAANAHGAVTSKVARLTVAPAQPMLTHQPTDVSLPPGTTLRLAVGVFGLGPFDFRWYQDGSPLPGSGDPLLTRSNITAAMAGAYHVVVMSPWGNATSRLAQVTVTAPPLLRSPLAPQALDRGQPFRLPVEAMGSGPVSYAWDRDGDPLPNQTGPTLSIPSVTSRDEGLYRVQVSNPWGKIAATALLTVFTPPGQVVGWGDDQAGQATPPSDLTNVVAVAGGDFHSVALRRDGTVVTWGYAGGADLAPPPGCTNIIAIAAGARHCLALRLDGTVLAWGDNRRGQTQVPAGTLGIRAIAAGELHSVALRQDGRALVWGDNTYGQLAPPPGNALIRRIAAGRHHTLALRQDGPLLDWGLSVSGQTSSPVLGAATALAAGYLHSLALLEGGAVVGWGDTTFGQSPPPDNLPPVAAIAAGELHSLGLLADGRVTGWGDPTAGSPPEGLKALALGSGAYHGLAIVPPPPAYRLTTEGLVLSWPIAYILQQATNAAGPYSDVAREGFHTLKARSEPAAFFRLRGEP